MTNAEFDPRGQELAAALADGQTRLDELGLLLKGRDPEHVLDSIERLRTELRRIDDVLAKIYSRGISAEREEGDRLPFGAAWITVARRRLAVVTNAAAWQDEWLATWSKALAARRFETADAVANIDNNIDDTDPDVATLRPHLLSITRDLGSADWRNAVASVDRVLSTGIAQTAPDTRLRVLKSRVLRRWLDDLDDAEAAAMQAMDRTASADPELHDLAIAAVAEIRLDREEWDDVRVLTKDVLERDVGAPDLLIAAGRLAEAEARFTDARDCYDAAALRFGRTAAGGALYVESPGTLLWRIARQIRWVDGQGALDLIDRALAEGVTGKGTDPERRVILDRARILDQLERSSDAARAYHEAGERYAWSGSDRALELFERAVQLDEHDPLFRWSLGEALRQRATAREWAVDRDLLQRAKVELDEGFDRAAPEPYEAWAFASLALVNEALNVGDDQALLFERALLCNPEYVRAYTLLAVVLREQGYYAEALHAAATGYTRDRADTYVTLIYAYSQLDMGDIGGAQQTLDEYRRHNEFDLDLHKAQANIYLRQNNPAAALEWLNAVGDEPRTRFERAACYAALRDYANERKLSEQILNDSDDTTHPSMHAWVNYRLGSPDVALDEFSQLNELPGQPVSSSGLDLAQMFLLRGSATDIENGRQLLLSSIETSRTIGNLAHLAPYELPLLIDAVLGKPQETVVRQTCAEAAEACSRRIEELRSRHRSEDLPSVQFASARMAVARNDLRLAVQLYVPFGHSAPEVAGRLTVLAEQLMNEADAQLADGNRAAAQEKWEWLRDNVSALLDDRIGDGIRTRLALCDIDASRPLAESSADHLRQLTKESLSEVVRNFARDVPSLWTQLDGLSEVFAEEPESSPAANVAGRRRLYADVYALGRNAVLEFAMSPFVGAIEIVLGGELAHLTDSSPIEQPIRDLCDGLTDEMGVWVPGVGVRVQHDLDPHTASFQVYGRTMATVSLHDRRREDLAPLLHRLEDVLRDNLFRWISVDDLELWDSNWDASSERAADEQSWLPRSPEGRLRLTGLLRMLVREGVPIRDRDTIGRTFTDTASTDPYDLLAAARRRLYPWTLGTADPETVEPIPLPADLEARVAAGLDGDGATWGMSRADAIQLIEDLHSWRASALPSGRVAIRTASLAHRPYVWRLLAAERPRIFVVATEELP
jgi:tetratricopeptide (TPR) repeat protein